MVSFNCNTFGTIILGDFNVHNKAWLKYSSHDSPEGYALQNFCQRHGFQNYVTMPTRGKHLLDLVLSDLADHVRCEVLPPISDHNLVLTFVSIRYELGERQIRSVFNYKSANWRGLRQHLADQDWQYFATLHPDAAVEYLKNFLHNAIDRFIPQRSISLLSSAHS